MELTIYHLMSVVFLFSALMMRQLIQVNIWSHRKLHLNWLADFHEKHIDLLVIVFRIILIIFAVLFVLISGNSSSYS